MHKAWAEIQKRNESDHTMTMRRQYTDFGSPWRGIIQKAARLNIGMPKQTGEFAERTVFEKAKQFFKVGVAGNTPYKKIPEVAPIYPRTSLPGEYTTMATTAARSPKYPKQIFRELRDMKRRGTLITTKTMPGGKDIPLFHGLEFSGGRAGIEGVNSVERSAALMRRIQRGVIGNQLSQSSNPIGSIGIITRSNVQMAFRGDINSAAYGKYRYVVKQNLYIPHVDGAARLQSLSGYKPPNIATRGVYDEMVATPSAVTGVWSKSDPESIRTGKELAKRLGVPTHVVEDKTTIQQMFPKQWNKIRNPEVTPRNTIRPTIPTIDTSAHVTLAAHESKIGHTKYGNAKTPSHLFKDLI